MDDQERNGPVHPEPHDDFHKIKKIYPPAVRVLYELGINRFADLARMTPADLAALLRSNKVGFVSAQRIEREDWIGQASALAGQEPAAGADGTAQEAAQEAAQIAGAEADPPAEAPAPDPQEEPAPGGWHELADFFVSFGQVAVSDGQPVTKTRAHYSQAGRDQEWDGIATDALIEWMLNQSNLSAAAAPPQAEPVEIEALAPPGTQEEQRLAVSDVWVSLVNPTGRPADRMIRVETEISLANPAYGILPGQVSFTISLYLVDMQKGGAVFIETPPVEAAWDNMPYAFRHDFAVPPPGRYQLYLLTRLSAPGTGIALETGPIVRVEG